jgi:hypothetical protein
LKKTGMASSFSHRRENTINPAAHGLGGSAIAMQPRSVFRG